MSYRSYSQRDESIRGRVMSSGSLGSGAYHGGGSGGQSGEDSPPMSRLFVICNKANNEQDIRDAFDKFGDIEDIWVVQNKSNGENKGVVYIKYAKTSSAAKALEEMNGRVINNSVRPIKVVVASNRNQGSNRSENEKDKYVRLFVIVPKDMSEDDLRAEFETFGDVEHVSIVRDKVTKERRGFAYIRFAKFSHAAEAFEDCNAKFKAVFAEPKSSPGSGSNASASSAAGGASASMRCGPHHMNSAGGMLTMNGGGPLMGGNEYGRFEAGRSTGAGRFGDDAFGPGRFDFGNNGCGRPTAEASLTVVCSASLNQDQLWRLFDIVPGLEYFQITGECNHNSNYASAVYNNPEAAIYARDKLRGFEYPPGERLFIKQTIEIKPPNGDGTAGAGGPSPAGGAPGTAGPDGLYQSDVTFSSVPLPEPQPLVDAGATCAKRCFVVCVPKSLPPKTLQNVFCRFGQLIDVYLLQNKNCGYAKFASEASAQAAIDCLHRADICGVKLKVMDAEEPRYAKRKRYEDD